MLRLTLHKVFDDARGSSGSGGWQDGRRFSEKLVRTNTWVQREEGVCAGWQVPTPEHDLEKTTMDLVMHSSTPETPWPWSDAAGMIGSIVGG